MECLRWGGSCPSKGAKEPRVPIAVAGYAVYRDGTKISAVPVGSTSFVDTGVTPGVDHTYTVSAIDAAANESPGSSGWTGAATSEALSTTYSYDAENRLTALSTGGTSIGSYAHDGAGDRVAKTTAAGMTAYTLDLASALPQVIAETTGSSTTTYAFAGGPLELDRAGSTYWYQTDTLGSVRLLTHASGNSASSYNYSAFGATRTSSGSVANEVRFSGERTDTESGLEFLRARTYDPATGTFLQRDTFGITPTDSQSLDLYAYTSNNPVNAVDPSGHIGMMHDGGRDVAPMASRTSAYFIAATQTPQDHPTSQAGWSNSNPWAPQNSDPPPAKAKSFSIPPVHGIGGTVDRTPESKPFSNIVQTHNMIGGQTDREVNSAGLCVNGNGGAGITIFASFCVVVDRNGHVATNTSVTLGASTSVNAGVTAGPTISNGYVQDLAGPQGSFGSSFCLAVCAGEDTTVSHGSKGQPIWQQQVGIGVGQNIPPWIVPFEIHASGGGSVTFP